MVSNDDDDRQAALKRHADGHGFHQLIGYTLDAVGEDWARASIPHTDEFVNPPTERVMHGGVAATSLDATMGYAVMSALYDDPERTIGPTLNLNMNFLATADEDLEVNGEVTRMGTHVAFLRGTVQGAKTGKDIASAEGIWLVFSN